jgi:hypothetical protein
MKKKQDVRIYLDEYILQRDMRIRMPKEIIQNLNARPGETVFAVYLDPGSKEIILSVKTQDTKEASL